MEPSGFMEQICGLGFPRLVRGIGFPCGSAGKETACNVGDLSPIPGLRRSPGEGKGYPLQYSSLENSMDCIVHGVANSQTELSDFHFLRSKRSELEFHTIKLCDFE